MIHPNNLKYILTLILDNYLLRFSSVVRDFDVWRGLDFVKLRKKTAEIWIEFAINYLNYKDIIDETNEGIKKLLWINDNFEVYMGLWVSDAYDIEKISKIIFELLEKGNNYIKMTSLYFINEVGIDFNNNIKNNLSSDNLNLAYLALRTIKLPKYFDKNVFEKIGDLNIFYSKKILKI